MPFKRFTKEDHRSMPLFEALREYTENDRVISFDVPGHKRARRKNEFDNLISEYGMRADVNSMKELDLISNPGTVIKQAMELYADLYDSDHAYLLVNGSTSGILIMYLSVLRPGDKVLLPRNIHKSALSGLVLSGGVPVFMNPEFDTEFGIATNVTYETVLRTIDENPDAKAIFLINPTYFGATCELDKIIALCRDRGLAVLVDEAHGALFGFDKRMPSGGASLGADLVTISMHKTAGSLTQSSILLHNEGIVDVERVYEAMNLLQTTSASYLLMASLDVARSHLAKDGSKRVGELYDLAVDASRRINEVEGLSCFDSRKEGSRGVFKFDPLKIVVSVKELGITGYEAYDLLRNEYDIQLELAETSSVLAVIGINDDEYTIDRLVLAFRQLAREHGGGSAEAIHKAVSIRHEIVMTPRDAFYAEKKLMPLREAEGMISGENLMVYPPGIPIINIGERVTREIIEEYIFLTTTESLLVGGKGNKEIQIKVIEGVY